MIFVGLGNNIPELHHLVLPHQALYAPPPQPRHLPVLYLGLLIGSHSIDWGLKYRPQDNNLVSNPATSQPLSVHPQPVRLVHECYDTAVIRKQFNKQN